ncbi:TlpA family protein disulfide reductase [Paenibacillus sp. FSL H7-0714]|uniref:TlpA family protein disulfide reductase n=1 Tax=Paenibacillus sp. FSL H7-0714 TaxID=2954735 RepID=UPI0030F87EF5
MNRLVKDGLFLKKISIIVSTFILLIALSSIIFVVVNNSSKSIRSPENIELNELSNGNKIEVNFSEKPTVFVFFTSWCPYCNDDAPKIVSLYEKYKDRVNIYGINLLYQDDLSEVEQYVADYNIKYPVLLDETGDLHKQFGEQAFPALFFMNSDGKVMDQIIGSTDFDAIESSFKIFIKNYD